MDDRLGIVVEIKFNDDNTNLKNFTNALAKLQEKVNNNGLNVGLNFSNKDFDSAVENIEQQVQRIQKQIDVLNNTKLQILNPKDTETQIKGTLNSLEQVQKALKDIGMYNQGEVKIKVTDIDKETNAINKFVTTIRDAQGIIKTFESTRGFIPGTGSNLNLTGYDINLKSIVDSSNAAITKLSEFKTKYNEILDGLKSFNLLNPQDINKVGGAINNLTADARKVDFENIKNQVKELETSLGEAQRIKGLGTNLGTGTGLNLNSSIEEIEKYIQKLNNGQASVKFFSGVLEENGSKMRQVNYTVNDGNDYVGKYKMTIDGASNSVFNLERGVTAVNEKETSFASNLKDMITNITGVSLGLMAIYKSLDLLKSGFNDAVELQSALSQINVTMNTSQQQLQQLSDAVVQQSKQWGLSATEVENAMKVYANMNETVSSIITKTNSDLILSKLSGLPTSKTTDSIQSAIQQFGLETKDSEKVVDILTSVSSNMSMDFSKGIDEIINGLKVSGSTAKEAGLDLSTYASILGSVIEKTRLGGATIGQGEKSIFSRIERVRNGAAVDDEGQDLSKTESILRSQGIEIRKDADSFKPMSEILQTISEKFKTASDTEKAYIADAAAGINQRNVFINTIEAYSKAMDMNNKAMAANGFAQEQVGKVMDTTQSKIEQLKATVQGMFLQTVDSKGMGVMVDDLKGLAEGFSNVVQHIGLMNTAIIILSTGMLTFNKSMQVFQVTNEGVVGLSKNASNMFNSIKNGLDSASSSYRNHYNQLSLATQEYGKFTDVSNKAVAGVKTLGDGMNTLTESTKIATIATTAFNAVIGSLIGVVISLAVEGVMKLVNAQKDLAQSNKEITDSVNNNIQNNNSNIQSLQSIQKEYESLKDKTNLTAEEQKRYNEICEQIAGINKEATLTYDSQGKAILNMKGNVDDLIKSLKEKNQLENLKLENNLDNQYKEYNNVVNKDKPDISQNPYASAKYDMPELHNNEAQLENLKRSLANYQQERDNLIKDGSSTGSVDKNISDINQQIDTLNNKIKQSKIEQDDAFNSLKSNITSVLQDGSKYNDMFDKMDSATKKLLTDSDFLKIIFKPNGDINAEMEQYKNFIETISNSEAYKKAQEGLQGLTDAQQQTVNKLMSGFNINDFAKNNKMDEYYKIMSTIEDEAKKGTPTLEEFKKALSSFPEAKNLSEDDWKKLFSNISNGATDASDSIDKLIKSESDLQKELSGNLDQISHYGQIINSIKDKGSLTSAEKTEIIKKDPDLIPYLGSLGNLSQELTKRINDLKQKSEGAFSAIQVQEEQKSLQDLVATYNDLSTKTNLSSEDKQKLAQTVEDLKGKVQGLTSSTDADGKVTITNIGLTNDRITALNDEQKYLQLVSQAGKDKAKDMIASEILHTQTTYAEVLKRIQAYKDEIQALQAVIDAKNDNGGVGTDSQGNTIFVRNQYESSRAIGSKREELSKLEDVQKAVEEGEKNLGSAGKELDGITNNLTADTNKNTESTKESTNAVKEAENALKDYNNQIKDLDLAIKQLDYDMGKLNVNSDDYIEKLQEKQTALQKELDLTKQNISANEANYNSLKNLASAYGDVSSASASNSSSASGGSWSGKYASFINQASQKYGVDVNLIAAVIQQESGWNPNVVSSVGAKGLMQKMEGTNLFDPYSNIMQGTEELANDLRMFNGNVKLALAAYNAGPGAVKKYGGIPPYAETQNYVPSVLHYYQQYSGGQSIPSGSGDTSSESNYNTLISGAESLQSNIENQKEKAIELQQQIDQIKVEILNSKTGIIDDKITGIEKNISMAKTQADLYGDGTQEQATYIDQQGKLIEDKYAQLRQKENLLNDAIKSGQYDEKTLADLQVKLADVKAQELTTIKDLHDSFTAEIESEYKARTKVYDDTINSLETKLNLLNSASNKDYGEKISLNSQILQQEHLKVNKIKDQMDAVQKLIDKEKDPRTMQTWLTQMEQLKKDYDDVVSKQVELNNQIIQLTESNAMDTIQKAIYGGETQSDYEDSINGEIESLNQELESIQKKNELLEEQETRSKNLLTLAEEQIKLQDLQNEKSIQQLTKDKSGNWQFQYVANQTEVDSQEKTVRDQIVSNKNWEQSTAEKHLEESINDQKELLQEEISIRSEAYSRIKENLEKAIQDNKEDIVNGTITISSLIETSLGEINTKYNGKYSGIISNLQSFINNYTNSLNNFNAKLQSSLLNIAATSNSGTYTTSSSTSNGTTSTVMSPTYTGNGIHTTNAIGSISTSTSSSSSKTTAGISVSDNTTTYTYSDGTHKIYDNATGNLIKSYDTGGETGDWGDSSGKLAILHTKERVLNQEQTSAFNDLVYSKLPALQNIIPNLDLNSLNLNVSSLLTPNIPMPDINSFAGNIQQQQPIQQTVNINADFSGVTNSSEIERAFNSLTLTAGQHINVHTGVNCFDRYK